MRVLFVTGEYPAMQGGVGDYTRRLGQAMGMMGAEVHVLTHADAGLDTDRAPNRAGEPIVHPVITRHGFTLWRHTLAMVRALRPEVVHIQYQAAAYGLHGAANLLPWRLRAIRRRPAVVTTFHDLRIPYLFPKAGPLRWQAVLALAAGSDAVVLTNHSDWDRLAGTWLRPRLHAIPIGSNIRPEPPADFDRQRQRASWGVGPGDWLLTYFGFLNANKGGETLVRCLAELVREGRPARLLMVGGQVGASDPTNLAYLAQVKQLITELDLEERVAWTGFTDAPQVSANLLAADCAVLPYCEGASLRHGSLMAALAHGLPVVTTFTPEGMRTATTADPASANPPHSSQLPSLQDGLSVLRVPPEQPVLLAQAVGRVMTDLGLRQRLSHGAANLAQAFAWETIARSHLELYYHLPHLQNTFASSSIFRHNSLL